MKLWQRFRFLLGLRGGAETRLFELDDRLHSVVQDLARRERLSTGEMQADLLVNGLEERRSTSELWHRWLSLSIREQQVTAMTCLGCTNRQMAARLGVSEETVKTHMRNALVKFNLHGKGELRVVLRGWDFSKWA